MVSKANLGAGDVSLKLGNKTIVLKPTLNAAIKLSTGPGGLSKLVNRCVDLDFEAISDVITIGGQLEVDGDTKEKIFRQGLMELMTPCVKYLDILANGGKPADEGKSDDKDQKE